MMTITQCRWALKAGCMVWFNDEGNHRQVQVVSIMGGSTVLVQDYVDGTGELEVALPSELYFNKSEAFAKS